MDRAWQREASSELHSGHESMAPPSCVNHSAYTKGFPHFPLATGHSGNWSPCGVVFFFATVEERFAWLRFSVPLRLALPRLDAPPGVEHAAPMYSTPHPDRARELAAALLSELEQLREVAPDDADLLAALKAVQAGGARLEAYAARVAVNGPTPPDPIAAGALDPRGPSPDPPRATGIIEPPTPDATKPDVR